MSRRRKLHATKPAARQSAGTSPASGDRGRGAWRIWTLRIAAIVIGPALLLLTAEAALRLGGYGQPTSFLLKTRSGDAFVANEAFAWQFWLHKPATRPDCFRLPVSKAPGTVRIFVLGESAAMGTPDPAFSFSRILEVMLRRQHPGVRFEIVNAAMRGINSHVVRPIAEECAAHQPDLFLVYMGHNEAIGLHAPESGSRQWSQNLALIRGTQRLKSSRLGQLLKAPFTGRAERPEEVQDAEFFRRQCLAADDPRREQVRANFRQNLTAICEVAAHAGAKTVLCTVASNLKDFPPLGSLHASAFPAVQAARWEEAYARGVKAEQEGRRVEAIEHYRTAVQLDDRYAELQFRLARTAVAAHDRPAARTHYALARDADALPFRADSQLNAIVREVASRYAGRGALLVDIERALPDLDPGEQGIPGKNLFNDHVHPTFEGDYRIAQALYPAVVSTLGQRLGTVAAATLPSRPECAEALAFTAWDEVNVRAAMVQLTSRPPFTDQLDHARRQAVAEEDLRTRQAALTPATVERALDTYRHALKARPDDAKLHLNFGLLLRELQRPEAAAEQFDYLIASFPHIGRFRALRNEAIAEARPSRTGRGPAGVAR